MSDETQNPGYDAQEPNNAPDPWGDAANLEGFEEFGQEQSSGEEAADVVGKRLPPWMVRTAAGAGAEEADQFAPEGLAAEPEDPAASVDFSDPALYEAGANADPWGGTPTPSTAEQEGESSFTPPWEDPNAPPPGTVEQEEGGSFNPLISASWEDLGVPSPGTAEQEGEPIFTPPWEDPNAPPPGTVEHEEPTFAAPWEDVSTAPDPDPSTFAVGWDSVPDTPPEGQEDYSSAVYGEIPNPLDVWSDPSGVAEEITAAGDVWKDTAEDLVEDMSGAFEDVGEAIEDVFDDQDAFDDTF
jgi:hypothetical protein